MSLSSKIWIYWEKKGWTGPFKILGIANANIIVNTGNVPVTFWNTYVKLYYCYTKVIVISYLEITKDLMENLAYKPGNKEIYMSLYYLNL